MKSKHKLMKRIFESQGMQVNFDSFGENVEEEIVQEWGGDGLKATDRINFPKMDSSLLKAVGGEHSLGGKLLYNWYNSPLGHLYNSVKDAFGDSWQEKVRNYGKANDFSDELILRLGGGKGSDGGRIDIEDDRTQEGEKLAKLFNSGASRLSKFGDPRAPAEVNQLLNIEGPKGYTPFKSIIQTLSAVEKAQEDEQTRKAVYDAMDGIMTISNIWGDIVSSAGQEAGLVAEGNSKKKV